MILSMMVRLLPTPKPKPVRDSKGRFVRGNPYRLYSQECADGRVRIVNPANASCMQWHKYDARMRRECGSI